MTEREATNELRRWRERQREDRDRGKREEEEGDGFQIVCSA